MKRLAPLFVILLAAVLLLAGCGNPTYTDDGAEETPAISLSVTIRDGEGKDLFSGTVDVKSENPTVYMATVAALKKAELSYSEAAGNLGNFGGIMDAGGMAWQCTKNDAAASSSDAVAAGDTVLWQYAAAPAEDTEQPSETDPSPDEEQPSGEETSSGESQSGGE